MIIIDWIKWKFHNLRYYYRVERLADKRYAVVCEDKWAGTEYNVSGRLLSKTTANELAKELRAFKTFRDSKTEEGRDFKNPQVKAWLRRQRTKKVE